MAGRTCVLAAVAWILAAASILQPAASTAVSLGTQSDGDVPAHRLAPSTDGLDDQMSVLDDIRRHGGKGQRRHARHRRGKVSAEAPPVADHSTLGWLRRLMAKVLRLTAVSREAVSSAPHMLVGLLKVERCYVLNDGFGYAMQAVLFTACLGSLFVKWACEQPRRHLLIFSLDCSKQLAGALWYHVLNLLLAESMSRLTTGGDADECAWYLVNFVIDCSCGLVMNVTLLKLSERHMGYRSGNYFNSCESKSGESYTVVHWREWSLQLFFYCGVVSLSKMLIVAMMLMTIDMWARVGVLATGWITDVDLRLLFVMVVAPAFLDVFFFWVTDEYIKSSPATAAKEKKGGLMSMAA